MLPTTVFALWTTPTLDVDASYDEATNQVKATVTIGAHEVGAVQFTLNYDSTKLAINGTPNGQGFFSSAIIGTLTAGKITGAWADINGATSSEAVQILSVTFDVISGKSGDVLFSIDNISLTDISGDNEETSAGAGSTLTKSLTIPAPPVAVTGVEMKNSTSITVGKTEQLTAIVKPDDATNKDVTWTSSAPYVATVSNNGLVTAIAEGDATITATSAADPTKSASCAVTVTAKLAQTITSSDVTATYGDTDKSVSATASGKVTYAVKSGSETYIDVDATSGALTIKKVGEAYVTIAAAETADYASATKDIKVIINPKSITPTVTANVPSEGYTYDGSTKIPSVTVKDGEIVIGADQYDVEYADNINAGTAKITVTAKTGANYTWVTPAEETFSIKKADQIINGGSFSATVGSTVAMSDKFSAHGTLSYEITGANSTGSEISGSTLRVGTTAGSFQLKVSAAETDNYNSAEKIVTVTVSEKATQTITSSDVTATYGDMDKSVSATASGKVTYAVKSGSEAYIDVDATSGALTIKKVGEAYVTITAAETADYASATKDIKVIINPKKITVLTADPKTYTYNGKDQTYGITETAYYTVFNGVQKNADTYTVTVVLKDKDNTVWADTNDTIDKNFDFVIEKATITITAKDKTADVGDTAPELGTSDYTVVGLVDGETLKAAPDIAYESTPDMTKSGNVTIKVSGAVAPDGGNYNTIVYVDGTLTIKTKTSGSTDSGFIVINTYAITVDNTKNGDVTSSHKTAYKDTTVTLTVEPDKGYTLDTLTVTNSSGKEIKLTEKDGRYTFTMPASEVTVKAIFMDDNTMLNCFMDVPTDAYYYDAVLWAAENGITGGIDDTHFAPNATCTRAQAVTFLWRAAGSPAPKSSNVPFEDVAADSYYHDAVLWAMENGITKGTSDTTFSPNEDCTRAQIVTFLWRAQKSPTACSVNPFTDVTADTYYFGAVLWAVENGITTGTTATTFSPDADCTRAQIVTFIWRALAE